jgi:hypothetical protein
MILRTDPYDVMMAEIAQAERQALAARCLLVQLAARVLHKEARRARARAIESRQQALALRSGRTHSTTFYQDERT